MPYIVLFVKKNCKILGALEVRSQTPRYCSTYTYC